MAMLLVFCALKKELDIRLCVRHLEHGIRGEESREDARFVKTLAESLGIDFKMFSVNVPDFAKEHSLSLEEAARKLRYDFLLSGDYDYVATAHNSNDNGETILFNLVRGSGIKGLSGIAPKSIMGEKTIIRPMLCVTREEIEEFLRSRGQDFCIDSTNTDSTYSRNFIRHEIMPLLKQLNERALEHINSAGNILGDTMKILDGQVSEILETAIVEDNGSLSLDTEEIPNPLLESCIRGWLGKILPGMKDIGKSHILAIMGLLSGKTGTGVDIPGGRVENSYGRLIFLSGVSKGSSEDRWEIEIDKAALRSQGRFDCTIPGYEVEMRLFPWDSNMEILKENYTKQLDYGKITGGVSIRKRQDGDYFSIKNGEKTFSRYCIDEKIPRQVRDSIPLICQGNHILWAIGHRVSNDFLIGPDTREVLLVSVKELEDVR